MKPHLLKIPKAEEHSFSVRYDVVSFFYNKWHYHPELELVYIIEASGQTVYRRQHPSFQKQRFDPDRCQPAPFMAM